MVAYLYFFGCTRFESRTGERWLKRTKIVPILGTKNRCCDTKWPNARSNFNQNNMYVSFWVGRNTRIRGREQSRQESATRGKISVMIDQCWAVITAKSDNWVARINARRLEKFFLGWVPKKFSFFSLFASLPSPHQGSWYVTVIPYQAFLKLKCLVCVPVRAQQNGHGMVLFFSLSADARTNQQNVHGIVLFFSLSADCGRLWANPCPLCWVRTGTQPEHFNFKILGMGSRTKIPGVGPMCVSFIGLRLTKTKLTLINRTRV